MKQTLIIISGSPCVGKTTVASKLFKMFENSAYCDGDWMWTVHPFSIKDKRLRNCDKNISFVLSNYLNSKFDYVFFSSVVATYKTIREKIISDIDYDNYNIMGFTLTCSKDSLKKRHADRGDEGDVSYHWLELDAYPRDTVINTDDKTIDEVCKELYLHITNR
ncbi:MAG: AAA family ATPase [Clostridiales bacterium]|nr:AAA family ATPase [Clostridiales bacterium]